jgi:hypothetical protein
LSGRLKTRRSRTKECQQKRGQMSAMKNRKEKKGNDKGDPDQRNGNKSGRENQSRRLKKPYRGI